MPNLLILGDLEKAVLNDLWMNQSGDPNAVHQRVGVIREISLHTCSRRLNVFTGKRCLNEQRLGIPSYIRHGYREKKR